MIEPKVFHLLPDQENMNALCNCPACRAFSPFEQYMITVITAADALFDFDSKALLFYHNNTEPTAGTEISKLVCGITPRENMCTPTPLYCS